MGVAAWMKLRPSILRQTPSSTMVSLAGTRKVTTVFFTETSLLICYKTSTMKFNCEKDESYVVCISEDDINHFDGYHPMFRVPSTISLTVARFLHPLISPLPVGLTS